MFSSSRSKFWVPFTFLWNKHEFTLDTGTGAHTRRIFVYFQKYLSVCVYTRIHIDENLIEKFNRCATVFFLFFLEIFSVISFLFHHSISLWIWSISNTEPNRTTKNSIQSKRYFVICFAFTLVDEGGAFDVCAWGCLPACMCFDERLFCLFQFGFVIHEQHSYTDDGVHSAWWRTQQHTSVVISIRWGNQKFVFWRWFFNCVAVNTIDCFFSRYNRLIFRSFSREQQQSHLRQRHENVTVFIVFTRQHHHSRSNTASIALLFRRVFFLRSCHFDFFFISNYVSARHTGRHWWHRNEKFTVFQSQMYIEMGSVLVADVSTENEWWWWTTCVNWPSFRSKLRWIDYGEWTERERYIEIDGWNDEGRFTTAQYKIVLYL